MVARLELVGSGYERTLVRGCLLWHHLAPTFNPCNGPERMLAKWVPSMCPDQGKCMMPQPCRP
jgi:hypothetical protein